MKKVENAGKKGLKSKRKPYQISEADFFTDTEILRAQFAQLINSSSPDSVAVVPSVSYGMANVINNLSEPKGKIIVTQGQFPSNVYPWQSLAKKGYQIEVIEAPEGIKKGEVWNRRILEAIDTETVLLAIGHVHWADGTLFQLKKFRERLDEVNALLVVDGTQSVGALPFDVSEIKPDALICAGYKWLMGPYSIGLAYYSERFNEGTPIEENWINRHNSDNFSELINYQDAYRPGANRYDVGERSNFVLTPMMIAALRQLNLWKPEAIQEYCKELMYDTIQQAQELGFNTEEPDHRSAHLFGLELPAGTTPEAAMKVFKQNKVSLSLRGKTIRISPNVYNDQMDVRKLLRSLNQIAGVKA